MNYEPSLLCDALVLGICAALIFLAGFRFGRIKRRPLPPTPLQMELCSSRMAEHRELISREFDQMARLAVELQKLNGRN